MPPSTSTPQLVRRDGQLYARLGAQVVRLERSHPDHRRPAYWRARDGTGRAVTGWCFTPMLAALRALLP